MPPEGIQESQNFIDEFNEVSALQKFSSKRGSINIDIQHQAPSMTKRKYQSVNHSNCRDCSW